MKQEFDNTKFALAIRNVRLIFYRITLRAAAKKIGISPATLSRMENEYPAEINNILLVCYWLSEPITKFLKPIRKSKK